MYIRPEGVRVPGEPVYFHAPRLHKTLLLNPELGTYQVMNTSAFTKVWGTEPMGRLSVDSAADEVQAALASMIVNRVVYYGSFDAKISDVVPQVPASVYWETTHGCSLRCDYCYMSADTVLPGELSTEQARSLIEQSAQLGVKRFVFTGGEALIRKDIFELGRYAKELGLLAEIITNATLITSLEVAQKVKESFDQIITSLDGGCPQTNDPHRGRGSFEKIVRGIKNLNAVSASPSINAAISELNVGGVEQLLEFTETEIKVRRVRLLNITFLGRGANQNIPYCWETYKTMAVVGLGRVLRVPAVMESLPKGRLLPRKNCGMGSGEIYVNSVGKVYPCKLVTTETWYCGDLKNQSLAEVLQAEAMRRAREMDVSNRIGCRTCMIRRLCGGGCRGNHMGFSGDADKNDPQFCWILRHGMISNLWVHAGLAEALLEPEAVVPVLLRTGEVWQPEIGTALPESELSAVAHHLNNLGAASLPMA